MRKQLWALVLVVVLLASGISALLYLSPWAEGKRPIEAEDIYMLKIPLSPVISPDGKWISYQVSQMYDGGWYFHIGISSSDGKFEWASPGPNDFLSSTIYTASFEILPRLADWSPDGKKLLYWSPESISIVQLDGGISTIPLGIQGSNPVWSPDGEYILYATQGQLHIFNLGSRDTRQITSIDGAVTTYCWSPDSNRIAFSDSRNLYLWDGSGVKKLTEGEGIDRAFAWSPDGEHICFMRGDLVGEADIYTITPDGEETRLTDQPGLEYPMGWSPDGNWLLYNYMGIGALKWMEVWVVDLEGNRREITTGFERSSWWPLWSSNDHIYFRAEDSGTEDIYEASLDGDVKRITSGEREILVTLNTIIDVEGDLISYTSGDIDRPTEVYAYDLVSKTRKQITSLNADFTKKIKLLEPVEFWFDASDGTPIQGWYLKPKGEGKHPLIMEAHGGPHFTWWDVLQAYYGFDFQLLAARGYGVVWINPRGSIGYDREFAEAIRGAWGISDSQDFLDAIDFLGREGWVDEDRLGFTGSSYGGYMTNWMITHTDRFKAAVSEAGMANLTRWYSTIQNNFGDIGLDWCFFGSPDDNPDIYTMCSPITYVKNVTTPTLFIHGVRDPNVAIEDSEEIVRGIVENTDTSVALIRYPEEGHGIVNDYVDRTYRVINWFDSYLMDGV